MDQFTLAEFAKNSENKEGADFTPEVQEAGIEQGSLIVSKLYNTMLGETTRVLRSWNEELVNVLTAAGMTPTAMSTEQLVNAFIRLVRDHSGGLQLGDLVPNTGTTTPIGRVLCNGQVLTACQTMFPDFYNYVINNTPYITMAEYDDQVSRFGQCGFCAVDGGNVRVPLITRPISGVSDISQTGQAISDTMRPITGYQNGILIHRNSSGDGGALFHDPSTWRELIGEDRHSVTVNRARIDSSRLGAAYSGTETRGKQVQYPYYIQVYTTATQQSLANVAELVDMLKYQNQLGIVTIESTGGMIELASGGLYNGTITSDTTFILPQVSDTTLLHQILLQLHIAADNVTINWGTTKYFNGEPASAAGYYNVIFEYDAVMGGWVAGQIEKVQ